MKKKACLILSLLPLFLVFYGCGTSQHEPQLHFGILSAQKDLWDEAIFRWKKVLESDPNSAAAHNNLAVAYEKKGQWEEAKEEYETALKISPKNEYIQSNFERFKKRLDISDQDEEKENKTKKDEKK
jgi:Tfp pilus assembly protein PilF